MTTPINYTKKQLSKLIEKTHKLYHWTSPAAAKKILSDKCIYSPATAIGLDPSHLQNGIRNLNDLKVSAKNGFMDYVYLGNCNWIEKGFPSKYGEVGFVINPGILLEKEFFVFPFNVGYYYDKVPNAQKNSDLTTLLSALNLTNSISEILVRRKINFNENTNTIESIICPNSIRSDLIELCGDVDITEYDIGMKKSFDIASVDIHHPLLDDTEIKPEDYFIEKNILYVRPKDSYAILAFDVAADSTLIDTVTKEEVGKLHTKISINRSRPR